MYAATGSTEKNCKKTHTGHLELAQNFSGLIEWLIASLSAMGDLLVCDAKLQENWPPGMATSRLDALKIDLSPSERLGWTLLPFDEVLLTIPGKQHGV